MKYRIKLAEVLLFSIAQLIYFKINLKLIKFYMQILFIKINYKNKAIMEIDDLKEEV